MGLKPRAYYWSVVVNIGFVTARRAYTWAPTKKRALEIIRCRYPLTTYGEPKRVTRREMERVLGPTIRELKEKTKCENA